MGAEIIFHYFPNLTVEQEGQIRQLHGLYNEWNERINIISRKDIQNLYVNHVLHSLGIAKVIDFDAGTDVLDVGTGGGFPGIPLAILFPQVNFHLVDSIGKKIMVIEHVSKALGLKNVTFEQARAEGLEGEYDFVVSRAVTRLQEFYSWTYKRVRKKSHNLLTNGILYLKGGDLQAELAEVRRPHFCYLLADFFSEEFFLTKQVVHISV
jgi:16S rRNA (guanine527-N7)-methyltransferase